MQKRLLSVFAALPLSLIPFAGTADASTTHHSISSEAVVISRSNQNIKMAQYLSWNSTDLATSNAPVVIVQRPSIANASIPSDPGKNVQGDISEEAYSTLANAPFIGQVRNDLSQGKFVIVANDSDHLLNDSLIDKVFNVRTPIESHAPGLEALGLYMPKDSSHPIVTAFYYEGKGNQSVTMDQLTKDAVNYYNSTLLPQSAAQPTMSVTTSSVPLSGGTIHGSGNYWYYNNLYTLGDGTVWIGQLKMFVQLQRTYTNNSNYSVWEIKMNDSTNNENNSPDSQVVSTWASVDNTSNYPTQEILQEGPATTNPTESETNGTTAGVTLSPENGGSGSLSYTESWTYQVPAVSVSAGWSGYTTAYWTHSYKSDSGAADSSFNYYPGVVMSNTAGGLAVALDDKLNMTDVYGSFSTGDEYDTIYCSDL